MKLKMKTKIFKKKNPSKEFACLAKRKLHTQTGDARHQTMTVNLFRTVI